MYVLLLWQVSWLCSLCVYECEHTTNCIHSLISKSPVGGFQALWRSFPSPSQVQVCALSVVPRHSLVPEPPATLTPIQRHRWREGGTEKGEQVNVWLKTWFSLLEEEEIIEESHCCSPLTPQRWRISETFGCFLQSDFYKGILFYLFDTQPLTPRTVAGVSEGHKTTTKEDWKKSKYLDVWKMEKLLCSFEIMWSKNI